MVDSAGLEVLDDGECVRLLGNAPVGRVVFSDRALPAVLPVNFAVLGRSVIIRTGARSRLAIAGTDTVVAFEADESSDYPRDKAWSVVAVGLATRVSDPVELNTVRRLRLRPWALGAKDYYLRIAIELISGRRLGARE